MGNWSNSSPRTLDKGEPGEEIKQQLTAGPGPELEVKDYTTYETSKDKHFS